MNLKPLLWIVAPLALSAGVIWLSAQAPQGAGEALKVGELADKLQAREKQVAQREGELRQLEERLKTLQETLERDRADLLAREEALKQAAARLEQERTRPAIDAQLVRTYENMDPLAAAPALKELAGLNQEVAVSLLAAMQAKKAARLLDQVALKDPKLAAILSERVGISKLKKST